MENSTLETFISWWQSNPENAEQITAFQETTQYAGSFAPFPEDINIGSFCKY